MKVGDLVKMRPDHIASDLGLGIIIHIVENYAWVRFQGRLENDKWILIKDLEIIN